MTEYIAIISQSYFVWNEELGKYTVTYLFADMGFETKTYRVARIQRRDDNMSYRNIVLAYEITSDGDLIIYSDEAFTGKIKLIAG